MSPGATIAQLSMVTKYFARFFQGFFFFGGGGVFLCFVFSLARKKNAQMYPAVAIIPLQQVSISPAPSLYQSSTDIVLTLKCRPLRRREAQPCSTCAGHSVVTKPAAPGHHACFLGRCHFCLQCLRRSSGRTMRLEKEPWGPKEVADVFEKLGVVVHTCHLSTREADHQTCTAEPSLHNLARPCFKI